jgi:hypothetical protein
MVVNSRLPVYKITYGDGFGDIVTGLFSRIAPNILPIGKELASKAIGVLGKTVLDEGSSRVINIAKEKIASMIRKPQPLEPVVLPTTDEMPEHISNQINKIINDRMKKKSGSGLKIAK